MKKKRIIYICCIALVLLLPLWMRLAWVVRSKKKLVIAIVDKTVLTTARQEHVSLTWILEHEKFAKNKSALYTIDKDYYGFFPGKNEKFRIKGLERFTGGQLERLSSDADVVYITDAYGIYKNEWYKKGDPMERSGILYGGLSQQDIDLLNRMKQKHKLILTEFNCIGSPTSSSIRNQFENLFKLRWTGWVGRHFESLDTTINKELPKWLVCNYKMQHNGQWPFTKAGIGFVCNDERVVIVELGQHLNKSVPRIVTKESAMEMYGLPQAINYPFWFDVTKTDSNKVVAQFVIDVNEAGKKELAANGIPARFPAVQLHDDKDYRFYYFSADFADNPITANTAYFAGIQNFKWFLYNHVDDNDRGGFFWNYYRPLVTTILHNYYEYLNRE